MQQKKADFLLPNHKKAIPLQHGKLAEWSNATVSKAVDLHGSGGSNPSLSAKKEVLGLPFFIYICIIAAYPCIIVLQALSSDYRQPKGDRD